MLSTWGEIQKESTTCTEKGTEKRYRKEVWDQRKDKHRKDRAVRKEVGIDEKRGRKVWESNHRRAEESQGVTREQPGISWKDEKERKRMSHSR